MALDITASKDKRTIDENTPVYPLGEELHACIFSAARPSSKFPVIGKAADYYADTTILYGEIGRLIAEIEAIEKTLPANSSELEELISFLKEAVARKQNLYFFCD